MDGMKLFNPKSWLFLSLLGLLVAGGVGCQSAQPVSMNRLINHQAMIDYKGKTYFIYHNGVIPTDGGSFRRSVCIDYLYYNKDGSIKRIVMTSEGVNNIK